MQSLFGMHPRDLGWLGIAPGNREEKRPLRSRQPWAVRIRGRGQQPMVVRGDEGSWRSLHNRNGQQQRPVSGIVVIHLARLSSFCTSLRKQYSSKKLKRGQREKSLMPTLGTAFLFIHSFTKLLSNYDLLFYILMIQQRMSQTNSLPS